MSDCLTLRAFRTETVLPSGRRWSVPDPEEGVVVRRACWPEWTWVEVRGQDAVRLRDSLSRAHAAALHAGLVVCVRPGSHGDFNAVSDFLNG